MHIRICTQVCKFLEIISDGMCCLLRPDLPLRWPSRPAPLSLSPTCPPLHTHLAHRFLSASPLCSPLPHHPLLFSPDWLALSFHHCALWASVCLGQGSVIFFFFAKIQIENIIGFVCYTVSAATTHLGCCSTKTGKDNTSANGCFPIKFSFQNQVATILVPQSVVCQLFQSMEGSRCD